MQALANRRNHGHDRHHRHPVQKAIAHFEGATELIELFILPRYDSTD
jgi:hypothetical protein